MSWFAKLARTFRPRRLDDELDYELQYHLDRRTEELVAEGLAPEEARREAARRFGNRTALQESARDRDILVWLETALQDLRFAWRTLRRNPGFAGAAIGSLALGIGANTGLFSLLNGLMLKRLPVAEPTQLVRLRDGNSEAFYYRTFEQLHSGVQRLSGVVAVSRFYRGSEIEEHAAISTADVQTVSGEYFDLLGVSASRGRLFHRADGERGAAGVAVISESYRRRHFGDAPALGAHFRAGADYEIVGVAAAGFEGTMIDSPVEIWVPFDAARRAAYSQARGVEVIGRLASGATAIQAAAEAGALAGRTIHAEPAWNGISLLRTRFSRPLLALQVVVGLVLLIACANLANLILAGAAVRTREIAVRQAIGAGRWRLVRQLLTESLLLTAMGGALAMVVAAWISRAILRFLPPDSANAAARLEFRLHPEMLAFTAALSLLTCLLFGLAPALFATRESLAPGLREGVGDAGGGRRWTGRMLAVGEVVLCTILLIGAGLFVQSLRNLRRLDSGFVAEHVLVADVKAPRTYPGPDLRRRIETIRERVAAMPGVRIAATSSFRPLWGFAIQGMVEAEGHLPMPDEDRNALDLSVSPGLFAAMGTPLLAGRDFDERDDGGAPKVAIVNEAFARQFFAGRNPVGRHFGIAGPSSVGAFEIVGLVKDTRWIDLRHPSQAMYYRPSPQSGAAGLCLVVRTSGDERPFVAMLERTVHEVDPRLGVKDAVPLADMEDRTLATERLVAQVAAGFGALALTVACVGLYGVLAYGVARRTREIGVRMALGASKGGVLWMVLRESLWLLGAGFAFGIPAALLAARLVGSMLFGLRASDPVNVAIALTVMASVSLLAAIVPARRAARVDPMVALR